MTVNDLLTQRDAILARIGVAREQHGARSVEYTNAKEALAVIDAEIARVTAAAAGTSKPLSSLATFSNR